ncbi:MAG: N-acetyl-alpha-D-glucosaminyl L-malate synthase BshA [Chitinophagales bacterium]|nr:N-acetyl-alpha-D-glucosaminyl L-malate synthase BshA [Chitinophagales bacterium]
MNIGIACYPTYGGSGVVATELGKALANNGHQVHFVTYKEPARLMETFNENIYYHEVRLRDYPLFDFAPYETALASKLVDVALNANLDIFHVHYAIPHASAAYMARQILLTKGKSVPVITTLHGTDITLVGKDPTYEPVVTYSINKSCGVTAVSESLKQDTLSLFEIEKDIKVIPNFIDFSRFKKTNKEHFKKAIAPNGEKIVVHTSNFRKVKRVDDVVKVYCKIVEQIPAKLLLIGDGPERQNIELLVRQNCNINDVRFLGKQDAVEELLAVADLFLMPSASESFGLAALEAMACEVPVVSSNAGGIAEVNIDGKTGFVCDIGDVDAMAQKSIELLSNDELLQQFRKNAYQQAKKFSIEKIVPMYEDCYQSVLLEGNCS